MAVTQDKDIDSTAEVTRRVWSVSKEAVAASQAGVTVRKFKPGVVFEIVGVDAWASAAHANARVDVKIGSTTVLSATIAPGTGSAAPTAGSLTATAANKKGTATGVLSVVVTTGVGETITDLVVNVQWRARKYRGNAST